MIMEAANRLHFYIETLGCPKNRVDSRTMRAALLQNGFRQAAAPEDADIILINTCSFIREAQEETINTIFTALEYKKKKPGVIVGLIGCFTEQFPEAARKEIPEADFFLGTGRYHELPFLLSQKFGIELKAAALDEKGFYRGAAVDTENAPYGYFRLARGCSRQCSFCVIPAIRGPFEPYGVEELRRQYNEEIAMRAGASEGVLATPLKEIILVSQDTVATPIDSLRQTLDYFSNMEEVEWIRLHYLFPDKRIWKILELFGEFPKLVPYLDIPFQHISPRVLEAMKRPGDPAFFADILEKALEARPDMEFRSSFIIGFPGETEKDIDEIMGFLSRAPLHKLALFRYSHEDAAPSAALEDDVEEDEKIDRINRIRDYHLEQRKILREKLIDKTQKMLVEEISDHELTVRRPQDSPDIDEVVFVPRGKNRPQLGDMIDITLKVAMEVDWIGEVAGESE